MRKKTQGVTAPLPNKLTIGAELPLDTVIVLDLLKSVKFFDGEAYA